MDNNLKVLGLSGSLRVGSYNKFLLRTAADFMPGCKSQNI